MAINKKLIHFKKYSDFVGSPGINGTTSPTNGYYHNIPENSIVFIQDTQQIWTHGQFYDGSEVEVPTKISELENDSNYATTDIVTQTTNGLMSAEDKNKLDSITGGNVSIVDQTEYDALETAGALVEGTVYYIRGANNG